MTIKKCVYEIIRELGLDPESEGMKRTPLRMERMWREWTKGYNMEVALKRTYSESSEMVVEKGIPFMSFCEHHFMPFYGTVSIAYVPHRHVTGLSKLDALVEKYSKRFTIQERMTQQIANELMEQLEPKGCMVVSEAVHTCKMTEGFHGGSYVCSVLRGIFLVNEGPRNEAMRLMGYGR